MKIIIVAYLAGCITMCSVIFPNTYFIPTFVAFGMMFYAGHLNAEKK